jgi:hypothetical protein
MSSKPVSPQCLALCREPDFPFPSGALFCPCRLVLHGLGAGSRCPSYCPQPARAPWRRLTNHQHRRPRAFWGCSAMSNPPNHEPWLPSCLFGLIGSRPCLYIVIASIAFHPRARQSRLPARPTLHSIHYRPVPSSSYLVQLHSLSLSSTVTLFAFPCRRESCTPRHPLSARLFS